MEEISLYVKITKEQNNKIRTMVYYSGKTKKEIIGELIDNLKVIKEKEYAKI